MRLPIQRRTRLWLVWLLVVFGALNVFGSALEAWRRPGDAGPTDWKALRQRQTPFERVMTTLRDDGDVERYFAYAEATFGRPYPADFVRAAGKAGPEGPPDPSRIATPDRPLVPWRDFAVEYPPGMMAAALLPALLTHDEETYVRLFALDMEAALTLAVWLAVRTAKRMRPGAGEAALAHAILLTLSLGVIAVRRYDPSVALAIAAAISALAARRPAASGAALGLAVALKGVPILLAPIFVMVALRLNEKGSRPMTLTRRPSAAALSLGETGAAAPSIPSPSGRRCREAPDEGVRHPLARWLAGFAAAVSLAGLAYVLIAGPHALDAFAYHGSRPIQIETIYSGLLILARSFDPSFMSEAFAYGSMNAVSPAEPALRALSSLLLLAGIAASWAFAWARLRDARDEGQRLLAVLQASLVCLLAVITLGKVFSPQYGVWLVPLAAAAAPFASAEARRLLPFALLLVQAEYPFLYGFLYSTLTPAAGALIALRTVWLWRYARAVVAGSPSTQPIATCADPPPPPLWGREGVGGRADL